MIEQVDAIRQLNLPQFLAMAFGFLLVGFVLEFILRWGQRMALVHQHPWLSAILGALTWQPLFWVILLGAISPLLWMIRTVTGWQRNAGAVEALVFISATVVVVRLINGMLQIMTLRRSSASVSLLKNLISGLGLLVVVTVILGYVFNLPFFVLLLAIAGGITGLTVIFQEPLRNLVSGVSLTLSSRLNPGDWVRLPSGLEGMVLDIQWDVTIIRQIANNTVVTANSTMTNAEIINYSRPNPVLSVLVPVGVSYSSDLAQVEEVTVEEAAAIMHEINGDAPVDDPVIRYTAFADFSIDFNVVLRASRYDDQGVLRHEFIKRLHRRYNAEGIVIPFPIRTLEGRPDQPVGIVVHSDDRVQNPSSTGPNLMASDARDFGEATDQCA